MADPQVESDTEELSPVRVPEWSVAAPRDGEPAEHHRWFRLYVALGPGNRHLAEVARIVDRSYPTVRRASARWSWRDRALAFDRERRMVTATDIRDRVNLGLNRVMTAADKLAEHLLELSEETPESTEDMARLLTSLKHATTARRDLEEIATNIAASPGADLDVVELAKTDRNAAVTEAMTRFAVGGQGRPSERIAAGRVALGQPENHAVEPAAQFLRRIAERLPPEHRAALESAVLEEADAQ